MTNRIIHQKKSLFKTLNVYGPYYLMLILPMFFYILFYFVPLTGLQIAFKDFNIFKGMWNSDWVGLDVFAEIFSMRSFYTVIRNTLMLNFLDLVFGFPMPIILALLLNEMHNKRLQKFAQSTLYIPHFFSWIIIGSVVYQMFSGTGFVNTILVKIGLIEDPISFLGNQNNWLAVYIGSGIWKNAGWGTIVYMAAMTGVDLELYEAAEVDGCNRFQRIWFITLPSIRPTIMTMLILQVGRIVSIGFDRPYVMGNSMVIDVSDVISTYIYRMGIQTGSFSIATAVGLFQSVVGFIFLFFADFFGKKFGERGVI